MIRYVDVEHVAPASEALRAAWRAQYERFAANLQDDRSDPYEEAAWFDAALTSIMLLVVDEMDPTETRYANGRMKSGRDLIRSVQRRITGLGAQISVVRDEGWATFFTLDVVTLEDALDLTQATRHGRSAPRPLEQRHIDALAELGKHPDVENVSRIIADRRLQQAREDDTASVAQATALLNRLGDDELARRAAPDVLAECVPSANREFMRDHPEYDECPVCWNESFQPDGYDAFGGTHTEGQCVVCGYLRNEAIAYEQSVLAEVDRLSRSDERSNRIR